VAFDIDANGIVHVGAKDLGTGKQQSIRIVASSGLTEQEIQRMVAEADQNRTTDKKKKELADVKNNADGLIYTTEKALEEYATLLPAKDMAEIRTDLEALKAVVDGEDLAKIKGAVTRLEGSAYRIADALYAPGDDKDKKATGSSAKG
jgi:molecular chaperone DnaK